MVRLVTTIVNNKMKEFLKDKKNLINLLILLILVLALPLAIKLIQNQQILKGRATGADLEFVEEQGVLEKRGSIFVLKDAAQGKIKMKLNSPLGPP